MPMIDLTVPTGSLDTDMAARLQDEFATILLKAEGAPDTELFREITWVYLHEVPAIAVGGRTGGAPRFRVTVTVPAGALSPRRKQSLVRDVHDAVVAAAGLDDSAALHVWTLIRGSRGQLGRRRRDRRVRHVAAGRQCSARRGCCDLTCRSGARTRASCVRATAGWKSSSRSGNALRYAESSPAMKSRNDSSAHKENLEQVQEVVGCPSRPFPICWPDG